MSESGSPPDRVRRAYREWARPRRGKANPEDLTNDLWVWLVENEISAHAARKKIGGASGAEPPPGWCFSRFGAASILLEDETEIFIAGEHEDSYDPDFYIYNDVIVKGPEGDVRIFGYPESIFPPTDFHSATSVGECVLVIGCLGYPAQRRAGTTPVHALDLRSFEISAVPCRGAAPDWLHRHDARLVDDGAAIVCDGGAVVHQQTGLLVENIDTWRYDIAAQAWQRTHTPGWMRWVIMREDRKPLHLWRYEAMYRSRRSGRESPVLARIQKSFDAEGRTPDLDLYERRHAYALEGGPLELRPDSHRTLRGEAAGLPLRIREAPNGVFVTIEGAAPPGVAERMQREGLANIEALEGAPCRLVSL